MTKPRNFIKMMAEALAVGEESTREDSAAALLALRALTHAQLSNPDPEYQDAIARMEKRLTPEDAAAWRGQRATAPTAAAAPAMVAPTLGVLSSVKSMGARRTESEDVSALVYGAGAVAVWTICGGGVYLAGKTWPDWSTVIYGTAALFVLSSAPMTLRVLTAVGRALRHYLGAFLFLVALSGGVIAAGGPAGVRDAGVYVLDLYALRGGLDAVAVAPIGGGVPPVFQSAVEARRADTLPASGPVRALWPGSQYRVKELGVGAVRVEESGDRLLTLTAWSRDAMMPTVSTGPRMTGWVHRGYINLFVQ